MLIWLALSIIAGMIASKKGRSGFGFFLLAFFLTPLVGILGAFIAKPNEEALIAKGLFERCPSCHELIKSKALVCKHCTQSIFPKAN